MVEKAENVARTEGLHLSRAPIVEAIIAIEFSPLSPDTVEDFRLVYQHLAGSYQDSQPIVQSKFQFALNTGAVAQNAPDGLRFVSIDGQYAVQLRSGAFIFSRLAPYEGWDPFRNEASRVWRAFRSFVDPLEPTILGLRYINKISFPAKDPVERYLKIYPGIPDDPDGGPQDVKSWQLRVEVPLTDPPGHLIAQEIVLQPEDDGRITVALDNDFRFGILALEDREVWDLLERARDIKNKYFVQFITQELLDSYR